ncbi:helix-turn-helix domain-containing protein [Fulvitalea axinellae]
MGQLNIYHRAQIFLGIRKGKTNAQIARGIGFHRSTVGREIERNGGRENYDLWKAQSARDRRQGMAVFSRMLFGGGVSFDSKLRKLNLKYAHLSYTHIHWSDYEQDRFFRKTEAWRLRPEPYRKASYGVGTPQRLAIPNIELSQETGTVCGQQYCFVFECAVLLNYKKPKRRNNLKAVRSQPFGDSYGKASRVAYTFSTKQPAASGFRYRFLR